MPRKSEARQKLLQATLLVGGWERAAAILNDAGWLTRVRAYAWAYQAASEVGYFEIARELARHQVLSTEHILECTKRAACNTYDASAGPQLWSRVEILKKAQELEPQEREELLAELKNRLSWVGLYLVKARGLALDEGERKRHGLLHQIQALKETYFPETLEPYNRFCAEQWPEGER